MDVTENKTACPKQPAVRLYDIAWNNNGSTIRLSFRWLSRPKWTNVVADQFRFSYRLRSLTIWFRLLSQRDQWEPSGLYVLLHEG